MKGKRRLLLLQLPVPQLNQYRKTLNIPLAPAWIAAALSDKEGIEVEIVGQREATYLADRSLIEHILSRAPDMVGLTLYLWNTD
ncbi:MAG: B12-binding domain-containing radical SAM protein, partial [Desulfatiglandales bacterium]